MGIRQINNIPEPPKDLSTGTQKKSMYSLLAILYVCITLSRKAVCISSETVPQTDTGGRVEYTKARE